ncbi:hypothetical protein [Mycoavidus sp. B2-EB]|uniref:hypothetical protein n=1 Tax=Mycoavidus sp. B2-EB TaxID=2651972 RepID=UPI001627EF2F|nr:hypothetical protein [Mycoavidus sp. B2-EB]BBO59914.1 putative E3 ubiquitin-protein ligase ipaH7.8 [Mycoavidus sp. B2-EB]
MKRIFLSILIVFFSFVGCGEGEKEIHDNWAKLEYWRTLGHPGEKRGEAVLRIQQCHDCLVLDLSNLNLTELPEILGDFDNLRSVLFVNLENNKLREFPSSAQNLKRLFRLNI